MSHRIFKFEKSSQYGQRISGAKGQERLLSMAKYALPMLILRAQLFGIQELSKTWANRTLGPQSNLLR